MGPDVADLRISPELAHIMYAYARWARFPTLPDISPFRCTHPDCRRALVLRYEPGGPPSHFEHAETNTECPFRDVRAVTAAAHESITEWIPQDEWMEMARWWGRRSGGEGGGGVGVGVRIPVFPRSPLSSAAYVDLDDDDCV